MFRVHSQGLNTRKLIKKPNKSFRNVKGPTFVTGKMEADLSYLNT